MKIYCQSCGCPNEYTAQKPNFCGGCGEKFYYAAATKPKESPPTSSVRPSPKSSANTTNNNDETALDDEVVEIPNIESLAVEINTTFHRKTSLKEAMNERPTGIKMESKKLTKKEQKALLQKTLEEGASLKDRTPTIIGGDEKEGDE